LLAVVALEDGDQLGDLELVMHALSQVGQLDLAAQVAGRGVEPDQRSQAAAIDVADPAQVDDDLFGALQHALDHIAEVRRLLAKDDAPAATDYRHTTRLVGRDFQSHSRLPARGPRAAKFQQA